MPEWIDELRVQEPETAEPLIQRALDIQERAVGPDNRAVIEPLLLLGRLRLDAEADARLGNL